MEKSLSPSIRSLPADLPSDGNLPADESDPSLSKTITHADRIRPDRNNPGTRTIPLSSGEVLFGRYQLVRLLGRGGMGVVWLGLDEKLSRQVALKFLPEIIQMDVAGFDDLKTETRRCLELTHPNIVRIYDFLDDERTAAISMEFIDGQTLATARLSRPKRVFDSAELETWLIQICHALDYAHHQARVVHRDLKPSNLMVTPKNQVKVADFGIARSISDSMSKVSMQTNSSSGTLVYMSPEQMRGEDPHPGDDIYALGATLYELLTGKPPFFSGSLFDQVQNVKAPRASDRRLKLGAELAPISRKWDDCIAKCLLKSRRDRFSSAGELLVFMGLASAATPTQTDHNWSEAPINPHPAPTSQFSSYPTATVRDVSRGSLAGSRAKSIILAIVGALAGGVVFVGLAWFVWIRPYFVKPGDLTVETNPPGASIWLGESPDKQFSPARYPGLRIGVYPVHIHLAGYREALLQASIREGQISDLGPINLTRETGVLDLQTVPSGMPYRLQELGMEGKIFSGTTPVVLNNLPTAPYNLTLSPHDYPERVLKVEIHAGQVQPLAVDTLWDTASRGFPPDLVSILSHDLPEITDLNDRKVAQEFLLGVFDKYLEHCEFSVAAKALAKSKRLGFDTADMEAKFSARKRNWIEKQVVLIDGLVHSGSLYVAKLQLQQLQGVASPDEYMQLSGPFVATLAAYDEQVLDLLTRITTAKQDGTQEKICEQISTLAARNRDDLRLVTAMLNAELDLPSDFNRVQKRCQLFEEEGSMHLARNINPQIAADYDIFEKNLRAHREFQSEIAGLKARLSGCQEKVGGLQAKIRNSQEKKTAYDLVNIVGVFGAVGGAYGNSLPAVGTGLTAQNVGGKGSSDKQAQITRWQEEISRLGSEEANLESQVQAKQSDYSSMTKRSIREVGEGKT